MIIIRSKMFISIGNIYIGTEAADTEAVCQYAVALLGGNIAWWMDGIKAHGNALNSLL